MYPNESHLHLYRNFFEEERRNDTVLHHYVFGGKYKNMQIETETDALSYFGAGGATQGRSQTRRMRDSVSLNPSSMVGRSDFSASNPFSASNRGLRKRI